MANIRNHLNSLRRPRFQVELYKSCSMNESVCAVSQSEAAARSRSDWLSRDEEKHGEGRKKKLELDTSGLCGGFFSISSERSQAQSGV